MKQTASDHGKNVLTLLKAMRKCHSGNMKRGSVTGFCYFGAGDFLLRHGKWYNPLPYPSPMWHGTPRTCFGNAIILATLCPQLHYAEGYAECVAGFPVHHAWCTDGENVFDPTWDTPGECYFGVEFSVGRAEDAAWNGDASVLDDGQRDYPLLRTPWNGEDWQKEWPSSPRLRLVRKRLHQFPHYGFYVPAYIRQQATAR